jgi:hypothetical protein
MFHRLTTPSYFGGLPAGYDYINNAVSGTPAFADGQKSGGPNAGTYFVAFGEDATSADANRASQALATNTDFIDDLLHRDLAEVTVTANVGPTGSPTPSVTLVGPGIFLGISAFTPLTELFQITDANDNDIQVGGAKIVVASISGGSVGGGFSAGNVTLTLNLSIPTGATYRVYYGSRTNLATLPADAFFADRLGRGDTADFEDFVKQVSTPGVVGATVTSLSASIFTTPDGTRLAQSPLMTFSVDPNDSGSPTRSVLTLTRDNTIHALILHQLLDDPTGTVHPGIISGSYLQPTGGGAFGVPNGTLFLEDGNLTPPTHFVAAIPLTSATASEGDQWVRTLEQLPTAGSLTSPDSLLKKLNARWSCTVGDGVNTFGDFNGALGLDHAIAFYVASGAASGHISVKSGTYTMNNTYTVTGNLVIEGHHAYTTFLNVGVGDLLVMDTAGVIDLRSMTMTSTASGGVAVECLLGGVRLTDMVLVDLAILVANPGLLPGGISFHAQRCTFRVLTAANAGVFVELGDGLVHSGFFFDECFFWCSDGTAPVVMGPNGASGGTVSNVRFRDCAYILGGTATLTSDLQYNTGLIAITGAAEPASVFTVTDVTWEKCNATVVTSLANSILFYISPVAPGNTNLAHLTNIGTVTMDNCNWLSPLAASAFSPGFICAQVIRIRNTNFTGTQHGGNAQTVSAGLAVGNTFSAADWGQFTFSIGFSGFFIPGDLGFEMDNVSFSAFNQQSSACDVRFELPPTPTTLSRSTSTKIKNVRFSNYVTTGSGAAPNYRLNIDSTFGISGEVNATLENVVIQGIAGSGTTRWATNGVFGIQPMSGVELVHCYSSYFRPGSGSNLETGYYINYGAVSASYGIVLRNCKALNTGVGLVVPTGSSSSATLDNLRILGGEYSNNAGAGILLGGWNMGDVQVIGTRCVNNGGAGIIGIFQTTGIYSTVLDQMISIRDNYCLGNFSDGAQIAIGAEGQVPRFEIFGNKCFKAADGSLAHIQVTANLATTPTGLGTPGDYPLLGVETGIAAFGNAASTDLVSGQNMMFNQAVLLSP